MLGLIIILGIGVILCIKKLMDSEKDRETYYRNLFRAMDNESLIEFRDSINRQSDKYRYQKSIISKLIDEELESRKKNPKSIDIISFSH